MRAGPQDRRTLGGAGAFYARVYEAVRAIPRGRVATYGQVAQLVGVPRGARAVGWALRALRGRAAAVVPWHRVVGTGGRISLRGGSGPLVQRKRLEAEGVRLVEGKIDLGRYGLSERPAASGHRTPAANARRSAFASVPPRARD